VSESSRLNDLSLTAIGTGILAAIVGFTSSFAVVLQGLRAAGANEAEATSGLIMLTLGMGISGIILAFRYRMPIGVAWSTPGAALLVVSASTLNSVNEAVGAYIASSVLLILAGWFRPLGRLIESIPTSLANAMLAGVLLTLCLAPIHAVATEAALAIPLLLTWWVVGRFNRYFAVPAALLVLVPIVIWKLGVPADFQSQIADSLVPNIVWIKPVFEPQALISIAIPLFVVTMASQNVPGVAVLNAGGYRPKAGPLIMNTGFFSLLTGPFGGHGINLAAITAAMFCSTDLVPSILIEAVAGLALLGSFSAAIVGALSDVKQRESAAITFLFAGSGLAFLGVGAAFWGLLVEYLSDNFFRDT